MTQPTAVLYARISVSTEESVLPVERPGPPLTTHRERPVVTVGLPGRGWGGGRSVGVCARGRPTLQTAP